MSGTLEEPFDYSTALIRKKRTRRAGKSLIRKESEAQTASVHRRSMVKLLSSVSKSTRALFGIRLAEIGFCNTQDEMLLALKNNRSCTVGELAQRLHVRPSTASKMVDRLVLRGLVARRVSEHDSRVAIVSITPFGEIESDNILFVHAKIEEKFAEMISEDNLSIMKSELEKVDIFLHNLLFQWR